MLIVTERWERILEGEARGSLEACLPDVLKSRRWFAGKARAIQSVRIVESVPIPCPVERRVPAVHAGGIWGRRS